MNECILVVDDDPEIVNAKIGRASCRERVSKSV